MGTTVNTNKLKKTIQTELLNDKLAFLTNELQLLLSRKKYNFCDNYDDFIAISFEYDYPFDFCFVGYPTTQLFDNWSETAIIQLPSSKGQTLSEILQDFYNVEQTTQEEFDPIYWPFAKDVYRGFFSKCWKKAKENANSKKRGFLFEHDISVGWDCDLDDEIHEDRIELKIQNETG